ncbi:MAG: hypothetical protein A2137_04980 [Chloroflexi bacterium RBG_16_58_8]|nr:MAG: hypothetical protein A2137_04980 [Chloroflexi bacterium RBG_16_58_8]
MAQKGLEARLGAMEKEITRLKDIEAVRKVEHAYSFYLVMWMPEEIMALFSERDDTTLEWPEGTFFGKDGLKRFFGNINPKRDPEFLHQMMHLTDVIDIDPDGRTARGRWWGFGAMAIPMGEAGIMQAFTCGIYENEFIKEDGTWKLWKIKWVPVYSGTPAQGWVRPERLAKPVPRKEGELRIPDWWRSDLPARGIAYSYPSGYIMPFHFKHPVTGQATTEARRNARVKGVTKQ